MKENFNLIKRDAEDRTLKRNDGNKNFALYLDQREFKKGSKINIVTEEITIDQPTHVVFVDDEPEKNYGHRCHYYLYNAETGKFINSIPASFPHFFKDKDQENNIEIFKSSPLTERYIRKKKMRMELDLGKLSAYGKLSPLPLKFSLKGNRYAILYSGDSNGRHVNDLEFLYRTLVDVYGFNTNNIFVLNYDGTVNYSRAVWGSGWTEPPVSDGFGPDGSAYRMVVNGEGNRGGFQNVVNTLKTKMNSKDCLLIHTNNHGWYDGSGGFLSAYGPGVYYASDFAADLAGLPSFRNLLVVMEQCASGSFATPVINNSPATNTVFQAAVPGDESSAGGWPFDPWAELWISAMAGVRGDGSALAVSPDDNLDNLISSWEAYDYALSVDNPVYQESSTNISENVFLSQCGYGIKLYKEHKEFKEFKEPKEFKEFKEYYEPKQIFEPKQIYEGLAIKPEDLVKWSDEEIISRLDRLEKSLEKLKPFITNEERPDLKKNIKKKKK